MTDFAMQVREALEADLPEHNWEDDMEFPPLSFEERRGAETMCERLAPKVAAAIQEAKCCRCSAPNPEDDGDILAALRGEK